MSRFRILAVALLLPISNLQLCAQQRSVKLEATLRGHTKSIQQIKFSHSGELIAAGSNDGTVRVWRTGTGESLKTIASDQSADVSHLEWSTDDRWLALEHEGKKSSELEVWEIPSGQLPIISQRLEDIYALEWSPNGHIFFTLERNLKLNIWDVDSKQLTHTFSPALSANKVFTVSFIADGQRILTASEDGAVQLWDVATGKLVNTYPANTTIHGWNFQAPHSSAFVPDHRFLISGDVNIHESNTGRLLTSIAGGSSPLSFSPDGKTVLIVSYDAPEKLRHRQSYLSMRNIDDGAELLTFQVPEGIWRTYWSPDGKTMAIMGLEFSPRLIDTTTGRENGRLPYGNCWPWTPFGSDGCEHLKFSADGKTLLREKEPIKLWDTKTVSLVQVLKAAHLPAVFSPTDGQLLATRSEDKKSVLLWRLEH